MSLVTTPPPNNEAAPPNPASLSLLYVKRKRNEQPNPSLFVEFGAKRQKVLNEFKFVQSSETVPGRLGNKIYACVLLLRKVIISRVYIIPLREAGPG